MDLFRSRINQSGGSPDQRGTDMEEGRMSESAGAQGNGHIQEQEQDRGPRSRPQLPRIMSSRSQDARGLPETIIHGRASEARKTSRFHLGLPSLPSARLAIPNIARIRTRNEFRRPSARQSTSVDLDEASSRAPTQVAHTERYSMADDAQATSDRLDPNSGRGRRSFRGRQRAEMHLPGLAGYRRRGNGHDPSRDGVKTKRFLFCFPWIQSRRIRSQILRCFVSGMFLLMMLAIYLALSVTKNINNSEFTILLILIILFVTIFFCHGLIRLCMLIVRPKSHENENRARLPDMFGPGGYAVPRRPIRVLLARDEEAAGLESETTKSLPPAYGLWRESVRVDPNRIYWQRNETQSSVDTVAARPTTANRPPSYASDDGVDYVVEARPRSMAPLAHVPTSDAVLPTHPSEAGRLAQIPSL